MRLLLISILAAVAGLSCAATAQPKASSAPIEEPQTDAALYMKPGALVPVEGPRRLNLVCMGRGSPVVLLEAGAGDSSVVWRRVQGEVARTTRVCAYDRAGYGFSDPPAHASDPRQAVADLHALVKRGRIPAPFVLVGHSVGGLYSELFAATYPDLIAGLVLVDPTGLEDFRLVREIISDDERTQQRANFLKRMKGYKHCLELARTGQLAISASPECGVAPTGDVRLDEVVKRQHASAGYWTAFQSELTNFYPSEHPMGSDSVTTTQIRERPMQLGDKPFLLLMTPGRVPPGDRGERLRAGSRAAAERLVLASSGGRIVQVTSGHYVHLEQPQAVIDAIREVIDEAAHRSSLNRDKAR